MKWPEFRVGFFVRSKPMLRQRIARMRLPRRGLALRRDLERESACDGDLALDCNPPAHPTVSGRDGHVGMRGVRVWKDPHIRKKREMGGAPGGEIPITNGDPNHCKFTGKERDTESGLDNFGARYFTSNLGRFMTPDWAARPTAVPYAVFGDPQSLNLYTYVENAPLNRVDADGHE